ncbi:MAG TPA: hypothetical protein VFL36_14195 [Myxococcales bacterium]|nr:hypothetical protein [Myxococcales bacterium]
MGTCMGRLAPAFGRHCACKVFGEGKAAPSAGFVWLWKSFVIAVSFGR